MISNKLLSAASGASSGWLPCNSQNMRETREVAYGKGTFVAIYHSITSMELSTGGVGSYSVTRHYAKYSKDGLEWNTSNPLPTDVYWRAIAYGKGKFVAVPSSTWGYAETKKAAYSSDGAEWTESALPTNGKWNSIAYGRGIFVAVSQTSTAAYSADGITWTSATMPSNTAWQSVTYGNGRFVAVGNSVNSGAEANTAYSLNGSTWTAGAKNSSNYRSIAYGINKFVAITDGSFHASSDGITWSSKLVNGAQWDSISFGAGVFIVTSKSSSPGAIAYSRDGGNTWTLGKLPINLSSNGAAIVYGSNKFVICKKFTGADGFNIAYLPTTMALAPQFGTMPNSSFYKDIAYGNGRFVVISSDRTHIAVSNDTDNDAWVVQTVARMPTTVNVGGFLTFGEGLFVYVPTTTFTGTTYSRYGAYSTDRGDNWTAMTLPSDVNDYNGIAYGNGIFVAIPFSKKGYIIYSADGITWTTALVVANSTATNRGIAYGNGVFVLSTDKNLYWSVNGSTWTAGTLPANYGADMNLVAYGNGRFICISDSLYSVGWTSTDGKTWGKMSFVTGNYIQLLHAGGKFLALSQGGSNNTFLASIDDNLLNYSNAKWELTPSSGSIPADTFWYTMAYGNGKLIAVAGWGTNKKATISLDVLKYG